MLKIVEEPRKPRVQGMHPRVAFQLMGMLVAQHPQKVVALLKDYGVRLPANPDREVIIKEVVELATDKRSEFRTEIAKMVVALVQEAESYDAFDFGALAALFGLGGGGSSPGSAAAAGGTSAAATQASSGSAAGQAAGTLGGFGGAVPIDPVSAVAMGVGSIADTISTFKTKDNIKEQARAQMQNGALQLLQQKEANKARKSQSGVYITLGILAIGGLTYLIYWMSQRAKAKKAARAAASATPILPPLSAQPQLA